MLKAHFLDLDETLCDTQKANTIAKGLLAEAVNSTFGIDGSEFADRYEDDIYRRWSDAQRACYMPIIEQQSEDAFRVQLVLDLLIAQGAVEVSESEAKMLQNKFDRDRLDHFDFFPGIMEFLAEDRELFTTVVITNGPEFSHVPKFEAINLSEHVDHIIIGGQEPEEKPAHSIFKKALKLACCEAHEAIRVGDGLATCGWRIVIQAAIGS